MKKIVKKFFIILLILSMSFSYALPVTDVLALGDNTSMTFTFTVEDNDMPVRLDNGHIAVVEVTQDEEIMHRVDVMDGESDISSETVATCYAAVDEAKAYCQIVVSAGKSVWFRYDEYFDITEAGEDPKIGDGNIYAESQDFDIKPGIGGVEPGDDHHFDGEAYVLWSCGNGTCYHHFTDIPDFKNGNSTFYKDTTITADNDESIHFDVHAEYKAWALPERFERWKTAYKDQNNLDIIDWSEVDPEDIISEYPPNMGEWEELATSSNTCQRPNNDADRDEWDEFETCVDEYYIAAGNLPFIRLQPVGEPTDTNAYVSYGDRNFKVVIYNEDYKGVTTTADFSGLHYYPARWADPFLRTDQYDVSATNEVNPTGLESILLENTVNIDILPYNDYELNSIEALDVPEEAVTITKINSRKFQIVFSSNFYDHVIFRLNDTNGGESYVQINRYTIDGWIRDGDTLSADFYFDRTKSHNQFKLTAKVIYNDGTVRNVTLSAINGFRDGLGNPISGYEADQEATIGPFKGKGLKQSVFECYLGENADRNVKDIYLNAEYTGGDEYTYAGAYSGSGEGTPANLYHPEEGE